MTGFHDHLVVSALWRDSPAYGFLPHAGFWERNKDQNTLAFEHLSNGGEISSPPACGSGSEANDTLKRLKAWHSRRHPVGGG